MFILPMMIFELLASVSWVCWLMLAAVTEDKSINGWFELYVESSWQAYLLNMENFDDS